MKITNAKTFDIAVKERANQRVQARIVKLKKDTERAITEFGYSMKGFCIPDMETAVEVLTNKPSLEDRSQKADYQRTSRGYIQCALISVTTDGKLPVSIWRNEEAKVEAELLASLDEDSKALLASQQERPATDIQSD